MRYGREHQLEYIVEWAKNDPEGFFNVYIYSMTGIIFIMVILLFLYLVNQKDHSDKEEKNVIKNDNETEKSIESMEPWKCKACSEVIESQFDVCWNCQTPKV